MLRRLGLHFGVLGAVLLQTLCVAVTVFCCIVGASYFAALYRPPKATALTSSDNEILNVIASDSAFVLSMLAIAALATIPVTLAFFLAAHRNEAQSKLISSLTSENAALHSDLTSAREDRRWPGTEQVLSSLGQELHDGPIQLLTVLGLKLPELNDAKAAPDVVKPDLHGLLARALDDLRTISSGLVLPQLVDLSTSQALRLAVMQHEQVTGTQVQSDIQEMPACTLLQKKCLFRIVREALSNSYRHANGKGQRVSATAKGNLITVIVSDSGNGISNQAVERRGPSLGLESLRRSVEELGGIFEVVTRDDGTHVRAVLCINGQEH